MKSFSQKPVPPDRLPPEFPFTPHLDMVRDAKLDGWKFTAGNARDREEEIFIQHADLFMASNGSRDKSCSRAGKSKNDDAFLFCHELNTNPLVAAGQYRLIRKAASESGLCKGWK